MSKKIIGISIIILIAVIFGIYQGFIKEEKLEYTFEEVTRGTIFQEISETGQVKKGEKINLSFKTSGRIEKIWVKSGEIVKKGGSLAKLEGEQLKIQLTEANANLEMAQAKLNKLLVGASLEEIQILKTRLENAKISFQSAKQNLEDIKVQGEENLKAGYEDVINVLDNAYLKIQNCFHTVDLIQRTYFTKNDQESFRVRENREKIERVLSQTKSYLEKAKANQKEEDIGRALSEMKKGLNTVFDSVKNIRKICEEPIYKATISSTARSSLDTQRGYINNALTNVVNFQQTISSIRLTNSTNLNTYQAKRSLAQGQLKAAEDELAKILASPRKEDIDLYEAQIKQVRAQIQLLESRVEDTILRSPLSGQVIEILKREGEMVQPAVVVMAILPLVSYEIKADIYEEDVVKINVGNPVEISLIGFPRKTFKGKITLISPAEKIVDGVVYYEVTIGFEEKTPEGLKPGMTADIRIIAASKENVLIIPEDAIQEKNGKFIVQVFKGGQIEEREIEIGLQGSNNMVEVVFGLEEGEEVIIK